MVKNFDLCIPGACLVSTLLIWHLANPEVSYAQTNQSPWARPPRIQEKTQQHKEEPPVHKASTFCTESDASIIATVTSLTLRGDGFSVIITFANNQGETVKITYLDYTYPGHPVSRSATATDNLGNPYILIESLPMKRGPTIRMSAFLTLHSKQKKPATFVFKRDPKIQASSKNVPKYYDISMSYEVFTGISNPKQEHSHEELSIYCPKVEPT